MISFAAISSLSIYVSFVMGCGVTHYILRFAKLDVVACCIDLVSWWLASHLHALNPLIEANHPHGQ
ncbi:hypothetical protein D3C75_1057300 [compost metagenome]